MSTTLTGHAAYRSWCEHCVKGRGRASPHAVVSEGELPEVGVDYAYLGPEGSQVTILVCKCESHWTKICTRRDVMMNCEPCKTMASMLRYPSERHRPTLTLVTLFRRTLPLSSHLSVLSANPSPSLLPIFPHPHGLTPQFSIPTTFPLFLRRPPLIPRFLLVQSTHFPSSFSCAPRHSSFSKLETPQCCPSVFPIPLPFSFSHCSPPSVLPLSCRHCCLFSLSPLLLPLPRHASRVVLSTVSQSSSWPNSLYGSLLPFFHRRHFVLLSSLFSL